MNPEMMLAQLAPLRAPSPIGWWPLAPGWWILIALALVTITWGLWRLRQRYQRRQYRRLALAQLSAMKDRGASAAEINALLKAAALRCFAIDTVAALHGSSWRAFLTHTCPSLPTEGLELLDEIYQPEPAPASESLLTLAEFWIRRHEVTHA